MTSVLNEKCRSYSAALKQNGLHRRRLMECSTDSPLFNFSNSDYLSLTAHPLIKKAYQRGFERYATGSGGSMVVCGYHAMHRELEQAFKQALQVDDCLLFSSGYVANISVLALLRQMEASVLIDKGVHASIYDGLQASELTYSRYLHNHLPNLAVKMAKAPAASVVITEGVFSMSGQCTPLGKIAAMGKPYHHAMVVDEAHSFGVFGSEGLGAVVSHGLTQAEVPLRIIPLSKAYAGVGAVVAGEGAWIDALLQAARPQIYSTAMSPAMAYGLLETFALVREADARREKLKNLIAYFRKAIAESPLQWCDSVSPIQQLQLGCPYKALFYAEQLRQHSIICLPMRQPTVSKKATGLRIILNYDHEVQHIDHLFHCIHRL